MQSAKSTKQLMQQAKMTEQAKGGLQMSHLEECRGAITALENALLICSDDNQREHVIVHVVGQVASFDYGEVVISQEWEQSSSDECGGMMSMCNGRSDFENSWPSGGCFEEDY